MECLHRQRPRWQMFIIGTLIGLPILAFLSAIFLGLVLLFGIPVSMIFGEKVEWSMYGINDTIVSGLLGFVVLIGVGLLIYFIFHIAKSCKCDCFTACYRYCCFETAPILEASEEQSLLIEEVSERELIH